MTPTLLSGVLVLTAGAPNLKVKPRPEPTLVGEWAAESINVGGQPAAMGSDQWVFRADGTMSILSRGRALDSRDYACGDRAPVRALDLGRAGGRGQVNLALYRIDGDTLPLSVGHRPDSRPADLGPGPTATVWVFRRVKD